MTATATAATDLKRGDVISNLLVDFIITDVDGAEVTYRYLDGNSIVREATMTVADTDTYRVVTATDTYVASYLDAHVGLPRNLTRSATACRVCGSPTANADDVHPDCAE